MSFFFIKSTQDQMMRGVIAGLVAGVVKDLPDLLLQYGLHIKKLVFWDYVGIMLLNNKPSNFMEHLVAFCLQVTFSLGLGVVYSVFIAPRIKTKHYLIRGLLFGAFCWFVLVSIVRLYYVKILLVPDIVTPVFTIILSSLYGLLVAWVDHRLTPEEPSGRLKSK